MFVNIIYQFLDVAHETVAAGLPTEAKVLNEGRKSCYRMEGLCEYKSSYFYFCHSVCCVFVDDGGGEKKKGGGDAFLVRVS